MENATDTFSYHVEGLSPYTQYLFRVVVSHTHGQTVGPWATLRTAEDSKYIHTSTRIKCNIHRKKTDINYSVGGYKQTCWSDKHYAAISYLLAVTGFVFFILNCAAWMLVSAVQPSFASDWLAGGWQQLVISWPLPSVGRQCC